MVEGGWQHCPFQKGRQSAKIGVQFTTGSVRKRSVTWNTYKFYRCVLLLAVWRIAGRDRPTAQIADADPDPAARARKLTTKEVADLFADEIGTWKIKGHTLLLVPDPETGLPGKPEDFEDTIEVRWKEKGKSTEARFSPTIDGKKVSFVGHKEYDAQDGVFICRSKGEGLPETVSRQTYDPKNKIYRGQLTYPDGAKETSTFEVVNKNKRHFKAKVEVEGKAVFSRKAGFTRMEGDNEFSKPEPKGPGAK
ncbi:MAG: hypothetical protein VB835_16340 [Pirellulales bacterium]